jgi:mannose-6-phosphate isomerase class I
MPTHPSFAQHPLRLAPDNFTPPSRTPWGGERIFSQFKKHLIAASGGARIGESWEVSVDPAFPSHVLGLNEHFGAPRTLLSEVLRRSPLPMLGARNAEAYGPSTPMLTKLLDAAEPLSVQVHPDDHYDGLEPGACGKPECWYILEASPGAGLYLGLTPDVSRRELEHALRAGADLTPMLNFVPVSPGDMFVIGPGTIHAIGPGVTLVEPQLVFPGKSGKTYRFWDWNRRYDAQGRPSPHGQPRELHIDHSVAVTRFDGPRGAEFVDVCRAHPKHLQDYSVGGVRHVLLAELMGMQVELIEGNGVVRLPARDALQAAITLQGGVTWRAQGGEVEGVLGESFILPAAMGGCEAVLRDARVVITWMKD